MPVRPPSLSADDHSHLERLREAMQRQPGANHHLETAASKAGMTRELLRVKFKAAYGRTPQVFLHECRLMRAHDRLRRGSPLSGVAQEAGYHCMHAFGEAFAQFYGYPPTSLY